MTETQNEQNVQNSNSISVEENQSDDDKRKKFIIF
jgi:hypothetical protein